MHREDELASVRQQVSVLAEQVAMLLEVISVTSSMGRDTRLAEEKLELLESLMWKLHRRYSRLQARCAATAVGLEGPGMPA